MIRAFFGIERQPFATEGCDLLPQQEEIYETLRVHNQQGGLCLILGNPGTGKSIIKEAIKTQADQKRMMVVTVARTLHTYTNTIKILCQAFKIEPSGGHYKIERRLIEEAFALNRTGVTLLTVIDDAHLLEMQTFRKLRLLFEDFPKNHNVVLLGQPVLMNNINLVVNEDIRSRVTYSAIMKRLTPDDMEAFILTQFDRAGLGHNTFTAAALNLVARSADGVMRKARNLSIACLLEGLRSQTRTIDIDLVNKVLIQPHWRKEQLLEIL